MLINAASAQKRASVGSATSPPADKHEERSPAQPHGALARAADAADETASALSAAADGEQRRAPTLRPDCSPARQARSAAQPTTRSTARRSAQLQPGSGGERRQRKAPHSRLQMGRNKRAEGKARRGTMERG